MLYSHSGKAISAFTGGAGVDRRDTAYLLSSLPQIKNSKSSVRTGVSEADSGKSPGGRGKGSSPRLKARSESPGYMSGDSLGDGVAPAHNDLKDQVIAEYVVFAASATASATASASASATTYFSAPPYLTNLLPRLHSSHSQVLRRDGLQWHVWQRHRRTYKPAQP